MSQAFSNNHNSFNNIANTFNYTVPYDASKILAWLSPLEPWVRHRDIGAQRVDSIGAWLLETSEFRNWHNGSSDGSDKATLFCHGNPGVGKSHIISLVIDKLCDETVEEDTVVTCFYFDFAARSEQSPVNMLGSLLRQLVTGLDEIPEAVVRVFQNEKKAIGGRGLQVSGILGMFQAITAAKRIYICVDALDECVPEHRMVVLGSLGQILQASPNTRIFITGRSHVRSEVERRLDGTAAFILIKPTGGGMVNYLREKLRNDTTPEIMSDTLEANIMESISQLSTETFLLASLHMEAILQETSIARRRNRLKSVKDGAGLAGAYGATLERIRAQGGEKTKLAIATLAWICHAERPLQVDELCHALAVEIGTVDLDPENIPSIATLLSCSQGLIIVDKEASTVRLIHFTVREYLCSHQDLFSKPHSTIAEACLTYLNSQQVRNLSSHPLPDLQNMQFLKYASRYWGTHSKKEFSDHARTLALRLLSQYEDHVSAVSLLKQVLGTQNTVDIGSPPGFSGLHCASFFGIHELVAALVNPECCEINQQDCLNRTPLTWAAKNGHEGVVKLLLGRGDVDPDRPDNLDSSPLSWAAHNGHEGVVKLLLGREDVDPDRPDHRDSTPLLWAAHNGHEGVVKLLLGRKDVNPDRPDNQESTPLSWAANSGHEGVVKLLLGRDDVDPNRQGEYDRTPLGCAAIEGHEGIVKLLLGRKDVDPNRPDKHDRTPLRDAVVEGYEGVVKLLLEREDVDPNPRDEKGRTPLGCAAVDGYEGIVKLLLGRQDVDPNRPDKYGRTPLGCAALEGHEGIVKLLLGRKDIDPNRPDKYDQTPLRAAAVGGYGGVVKLLLEREDVDPNRQDEDDRTPLGCAALKGHEGVVKLLLGREDVDPDRPDNTDSSPLSWAANNGHEGVAKLLLEREDVDPNRKDEKDRTPLGCAAVEGHEGIVKLLLGRKDVDPNPRDENYRTPLGCAAIEGHEGVVKLLLGRKDVDPNRPDKYGGTPLRNAVVKGHEGVVKLLLEREDVDPNRQDEKDRTPLGCTAVEGHEGIVKLLLGRKDTNPNLPDMYGRTPLGWAAAKGHQGVVKLLLERGDVDSDHRDKDDRTPLGCATVAGYEEVMKLLISWRDNDANRRDGKD